MKELQVNIKKLHDDAVVPTYAKPGDAGMDLVAVSKDLDDHGNIVYGTGLAFEIPEGYVGLVFPRSSNSKKDLFLTNSVGVIDSGYRGEVMLKFKGQGMVMDETGHFDTMHNSHDLYTYSVGDRVGQIIIMPYPQVHFRLVDELSKTQRGTGGYGSTGK